MATIKHISSKNANYGDAEKYLTYRHDEFTNKPILDEKGRMIPRDDYRIETILCDNDDFAIACMRTNLKYGKNNLKGDVKSHHYIISFDPRDGTDNGLTVDRAQELGMNFCKEHFPGHQAIVCTHPDGRAVLSDIVIRKLNAEGLNAHSFWHTHATQLIEYGATPKGVASRLGHANTLITQNLYTHNTLKLQVETLAIFDKNLQTSP